MPTTLAPFPVLSGVVAWGIAHWPFYPAQQAGGTNIAGLRGTPISLSLNASFMYLSYSLGAALGSLTLSFTSMDNLGWIAALCKVAALTLTASIGKHLAQAQKEAIHCRIRYPLPRGRHLRQFTGS